MLIISKTTKLESYFPPYEELTTINMTTLITARYTLFLCRSMITLIMCTVCICGFANATPDRQTVRSFSTENLPLERMGNRALLTIIINPIHLKNALALVQTLSMNLNLSPTLYQFIQSPHQVPIQFPFLKLIDPQKPTVLALAELASIQSTNETLVLRHRAMIPSQAPVKLMHSMSQSMQYLWPSLHSIKPSSLIIGKDKEGQAWRIGKNILIAAFPEKGYLRVEVATHSKVNRRLDQVSHSSWPLTPALSQFVSKDALISIHVKPWHLGAINQAYGMQTLKEVLTNADEAIAQTMRVHGLSLLINEGLMFSENELDVDDISFGLRVMPGEVELMSTMSLTPQGTQALNAGLTSRGHVDLKVKETPLLSFRFGLDSEAMLSQVSDLDWSLHGVTGNLRQQFYQNMSKLDRCTLLCKLYQVARKPLGLIKFMRSLISPLNVSISQSMRWLQLAITQFTSPIPQGELALTLTKQKSRTFMEFITQSPSHKVSADTRILSTPDADILVFNTGKKQTGLFELTDPKDQPLPESEKAIIGELKVRSFRDLIDTPLRLIGKNTLLLKVLQTLQSWQFDARLTRESRALVGVMWLGTKHDIQSAMSSKRQFSNHSWVSPIRAHSTTPQDTCGHKLLQILSSLLKDLIKNSPDQVKNTLTTQLIGLTSGLDCAYRATHIRSLLTLISDEMIMVVNSIFSRWETAAYIPLLNKLCELKLGSACQYFELAKARSQIKLPTVSHQCDHPQPLYGDLILELSPKQALLDDKPIKISDLFKHPKLSGKTNPELNSIQVTSHYGIVESKFIEIAAHHTTTMSQIKPWLLNIAKMKIPYFITDYFVSDSLKLSKQMIKVGISDLSISALQQKQFFMNDIEGNHKPAKLIKATLTKENLIIEEQGNIPKQIYAVHNLRDISATVLNDGVLLQVQDEVPWQNVLLVTAKACNGAIILLNNKK